MAECINRYCSPEHQAVALSPCTWDPKKQRLHAGLQNIGCAWAISVPDVRNRWLDWADVVHFVYNASFASLKRPELAGKKPAAWHLAIKWKDGFKRFFPGDSAKHYRFALSCEGWERYYLPDYSWTTLPVLFPIDTPPYQPRPFFQRCRNVSMTPRLLSDTDDDGNPLSAPRSVRSVLAATRGLPVRVINFMPWAQCMKLKARAWLGIDDVVNPLLHLSGFEYLSLGVPCINRRDALIEKALRELTGGAPWPFLDGSLEEPEALYRACFDALGRPKEEWERACRAAREWVERHYAAREMIRRYLDLYEKA